MKFSYLQYNKDFIIVKCFEFAIQNDAFIFVK